MAVFTHDFTNKNTDLKVTVHINDLRRLVTLSYPTFDVTHGSETIINITRFIMEHLEPERLVDGEQGIHTNIVAIVERHILYCDDCSKYVKEIDSRSIARCVAKHPYIAIAIEKQVISLDSLEKLVSLHIGTFYQDTAEETVPLFTPDVDYNIADTHAYIMQTLGKHLLTCLDCKLNLAESNSTEIATCLIKNDTTIYRLVRDELIQESLVDNIVTAHSKVIKPAIEQWLSIPSDTDLPQPSSTDKQAPNITPVAKGNSPKAGYISWYNKQHTVEQPQQDRTDLRCHIVTRATQCFNYVRNHDLAACCLNCGKPCCDTHSKAVSELEQPINYIEDVRTLPTAELDGRICRSCIDRVDNPYSPYELSIGSVISELARTGYNDATSKARYSGYTADYAFSTPKNGTIYIYENDKLYLLLQAVRRIGNIHVCSDCGTSEQHIDICQYCGFCNACTHRKHVSCEAAIPLFDVD